MTLNLTTAHRNNLSPQSSGNPLLASLPDVDPGHLEALCELVEVEAAQVLFEPSQHRNPATQRGQGARCPPNRASYF